ncbi:MAG: cupredoxin domain-containing protein [Candidatus Omnitrophica bacterium]|nr:cupredoxin domain-containing protein [Candidatus Omnitrophota bacterium]
MRQWGVIAGIVIAGLAGGVTLSYCRPALKNIPVEQFKSMLAQKDFILVDVHIPEERHLQATDEFIPYDRIIDHLDKLPDKNAKIVVYCRSGRMSEEAGNELVALGYTNIYNVLGGFIEMKNAGIPIDGPDRIVYLTARKFFFEPAVIELKQNDKARIIAKTLDVTHGFSAGDLGINREILPDERNVIEFTAGAKGEFVFKCSVYCGSGHGNMRGRIIVK